MARFLGLLILIAAAAAAALYVWFSRPNQEALSAAEREILTLHERVAGLDATRAELEQTCAELHSAMQEKEGELAAMRSTQDELVGELEQEIKEQRVRVERIRGSLRVDLVDEIMFDSGQTKLNPAGVAVVGKVGEVLKKSEGRPIRVHGHTDDVPIAGALATRYPTNWELSSERATQVVRFLQDEVGIDPTRLSATGNSQYQPRAANSSEESRRKNRRIEIFLGPLPVEP